MTEEIKSELRPEGGFALPASRRGRSVIVEKKTLEVLIRKRSSHFCKVKVKIDAKSA